MKNLFYAICGVFFIAFMTTSCSEQPLDEVSVALEQSKKSKNIKDKEMVKDKVAICHYSKESDSWKTITVSSKALKGHLKHGDFLGECDAAPSCTELFVQDFETDASGWIDINSGWNGLATGVASGTGGVPSSAGGFHAEFQGDQFTAPRTFFEGFNDLWEGNWKAEIDIYLDASWGMSKGFEYTVAANKAGVNQILRDFVFQVNKDASTGKLLVGVSSSITFAPRENLEIVNSYEVTSSGRYKFQHVFYDLGGVLAVDLNLLDSNGNILFTETLSNPSDIIPSVVGGNNYGWFTFINVDSGIAVDEHKRLSCPE